MIVIGRRDSSRDIQKVNLAHAVLHRASLDGLNFASADFLGAHLDEAFLTDADLREANFFRASLAGAFLYDSNFSGADLVGADLTGAYLSRADLTGTKLYLVCLKGADLSSANLRGADFISQKPPNIPNPPMEISDVNLTDADLTGARWPSYIAAPAGWQLDKFGLLARQKK